MNTSAAILEMNAVLRSWKEMHDLFSAISYEFRIEDGFLFYGELPVCKEDVVLALSSSEYDAEDISFYFDDNRSIILSIAWPEDMPPKVSSVAFIQLM